MHIQGRPPRCYDIQCRLGTTIRVDSTPKLSKRFLVVPDGTSSRNYRAAVKDHLGTWSEWSATSAVAVGNHSAGGTVASIGEAAASESALHSPSLVFPKLSLGSGRVAAQRTLLPADAFHDEVRRPAWARHRSGFDVSLDSLDNDQVRQIHRFVRLLNGPLKPFWFDWDEPANGRTSRYLVRFADPEVVTTLLGPNMNEARFTLVEVLDSPRVRGQMMTSDKFAAESVGNALSASPRWKPGSGEGIVVAGEIGARCITIESSEPTSETILFNDSPIGPNQAAGITFDYSVGTSKSGVVLRRVDDDNYVEFYVDHADGVARLKQWVGGTGTTLLSLSGVGGNIRSIRCELIGSRARCWYDRGERVADRPPDGAADVPANLDDVGDWGIQLSSSGDSPVVWRWDCSDLPEAFPPAPHFTITAASGLKLSPVTASLSGVSGGSIEWTVWPIDADDIPDVYRDTTSASVATRVFWLRPGYRYGVRARTILAEVSSGDSTTLIPDVGVIAPPFDLGSTTDIPDNSHEAVITVAGTKANTPSLPTMPPDTFPNVIASYVLEEPSTAAVNGKAADGGRETVISGWIRPRRQFKLSFENRTDDEYQQIIDFFEVMRARNGAFAWTHPETGEQFACRFAEDEYQLSISEHGERPIASISLQLDEVVVGPVSALTIDLTPSPDL